ncbi:hypothetical protein [Acrocarpospora pleiomorpha]|uniref:hypothetical protein n=1 Tax=Acrocarpospora pleiomorpha TaxID=90975 RepID=UPI001C3F5563|nr:hypothetical protein [Acrocarpospora pleiomorpha]
MNAISQHKYREMGQCLVCGVHYGDGCREVVANAILVDPCRGGGVFDLMSSRANTVDGTENRSHRCAELGTGRMLDGEVASSHRRPKTLDLQKGRQ